jgi:hypothetical protein
MTTNTNRDYFQAQSKFGNPVLDQIWWSCYAAYVDQTEEGLGILWIEKSERYESDKEVAMKVLTEHGYKFPEA